MPAAPVATPRMLDTRTRTRSRRPRSASGAANGATTADGTMRNSPTSPTAVGSPVPVRHDAQCHGEGPLRRPSREVAQLRTTQVVVYRIARERRRGHLQPAAQEL